MKFLASASALLLPVVASAGMISFDEFGGAPPLFETGTPVNDLYLSQGVRFRGPGGSTTDGGVILNDSTFTVHAHSGHDFLAFTRLPETDGGDGFPIGPETVTFTHAVNHVSIDAASVDARGGSFSLSAFDSHGALLGASTVQLAPIQWGELSVDAAGISKVVFNETTTANTFVFDDLTFQSTPEPCAMAALVVGFAGLLKNRRKSRAPGV